MSSRVLPGEGWTGVEFEGPDDSLIATKLEVLIDALGAKPDERLDRSFIDRRHVRQAQEFYRGDGGQTRVMPRSRVRLR